jgi:hypothetical protein
MFLNYKHSLLTIHGASEYFYCLMICLLSINKIFFSSFIFTIVYEKENHPKHSKELYLWRLWYDFSILIIDCYISFVNSNVNTDLILITILPLIILETLLYFLSVRPSEEKSA